MKIEAEFHSVPVKGIREVQVDSCISEVGRIQMKVSGKPCISLLKQNIEVHTEFSHYTLSSKFTPWVSLKGFYLRGTEHLLLYDKRCTSL